MKNFLLLFIMGIFLNGCVETFAILGPASTLIGGGNVVQSSVTSAANYGIKKKQVKPLSSTLLVMQKKIIQKEKKKNV